MALTIPPSAPPFSFEDEIFMEFGYASRLPKLDRCFIWTSKPSYTPPNLREHMKEDLLWLSAVINREWLEERRLDTKAVKFYRDPSVIPGQVSRLEPQDIIYDPRIGVNIIPKYVMDKEFPVEPLSKLAVRLKWADGRYLKCYGVLRVIPTTLRDTQVFLDFHVFDIPEGSTPLIAVGIPIAALTSLDIYRGKLQLQLGSEEINVNIDRSLNAKTEAKPGVDPMEEVTSLSLEEMGQYKSLEEEAISDFSAE